MMLLLDLFKTFFSIGLMGFGGGYAASALLQEYVVEKYGWLTLSQFTNVITISEMTPGPIGINLASFVGVQVGKTMGMGVFGGVLGTLVATFSYILPSLIIVTLLAYIYTKVKELKGVQDFLKGLQPAVVAMIASVGIKLFVNAIWGTTLENISLDATNFVAFGMTAVFFILLRYKKISPIPAILGSGVVGALIYGLFF